MEPPKQMKKKILKTFLLNFVRKSKLSLRYSITKFNYSRIVKKTEILLSDRVVIYYVLYNFFYTRLVLDFDLQKDFYCVRDNIDAFFLFLLQKYFDAFRRSFFAFCFFLNQKDFDTFHVPLFGAFLCFFDII